MLPEFRLSVREFYLPNGARMTEYRFARQNGWGGGWQTTPYLARVALRRALKAER